MKKRLRHLAIARLIVMYLISPVAVYAQDTLRQQTATSSWLTQVDLRWVVPLGIGIIGILVTIVLFYVKEKIKGPLESQVAELKTGLDKASADNGRLSALLEHSELHDCQAAVCAFFDEVRSGFIKISCTALGITEPHYPKIVDGSLCVAAEKCAALAKSILKFESSHSMLLNGNGFPPKMNLEFSFMAARVLLLESVYFNNFDDNKDMILGLLDTHRDLSGKYPDTLRMNLLLRAQYQKHVAKHKHLAGVNAREEFAASVKLYGEATATSREHNGTAGEWSPAFSGRVSTLEIMYDIYDEKELLDQMISITVARKDQLGKISRRLEDYQIILDHANLAECLLIDGKINDALGVLDLTDVWCNANEKTILVMSPHEDSHKLFGQIKGLKCYARMLLAVQSADPLTEEKMDSLIHQARLYNLRSDQYAAPLVEFARKLVELRLAVDSDKIASATVQYADVVEDANNYLNSKQKTPSFSTPRTLLKLLCRSSLDGTVFDGQVEVSALRKKGPGGGKSPKKT